VAPARWFPAPFVGKSLVYKDFRSKSLFLKDLASGNPKSLTLLDRKEGGRGTPKSEACETQDTLAAEYVCEIDAGKSLVYKDFSYNSLFIKDLASGTF
jgi:hypothetical protein